MIECTVTAWDLINSHDIIVGGMIADKLRKAGIPAKGILFFAGVERGTLYETRDFDGSFHYCWIEGEG